MSGRNNETSALSGHLVVAVPVLEDCPQEAIWRELVNLDLIV